MLMTPVWSTLVAVLIFFNKSASDSSSVSLIDKSLYRSIGDLPSNSLVVWWIMSVRLVLCVWVLDVLGGFLWAQAPLIRILDFIFGLPCVDVFLVLSILLGSISTL